MKYLIWDFNGTIIDDIDVCIEIENEIIKKYIDRKPITKEEYLNIFTFPVINYYEKLGFKWDNCSYDDISKIWIEAYKAREKDVKLFDGVVELLKKAQNKGIKNCIISASETEILKNQLKNLGVYEYFDEISGADDIYGHGKAERAKAFMKDKDPNECLYLGDTLHDLETANQMGIKCILTATGHQSKEVLLTGTKNVVDSIKEVEI